MAKPRTKLVPIVEPQPTVEDCIKLAQTIKSSKAIMEQCRNCQCDFNPDFDCSCDSMFDRAEYEVESGERKLLRASMSTLLEAQKQVEIADGLALREVEEVAEARRQPSITGDFFTTVEPLLSEPISCEGYANSKYWEWERGIATQAMLTAGFKYVYFYDGERDSFGPLSRVVTAVKDGRYYELCYG